jgi:CDP-diacylglycerol--glycerol-3-phosphate 3-phosphatidyltransferase
MPQLENPVSSLMTLANKITITRIALIPMFGATVWWYGRTVADGAPEDRVRIAAASLFLVAAITDGLDGFIARRFNQQSRLGTILDPIADKGLVLVAIVMLSISNWSNEFPFWFPIVVLVRDAVLVGGFVVLTRLIGRVEVKPSSLGKAATFFQVTAILLVLLQVPGIESFYPAAVATLFTFLSGIGYIYEGLRQVQRARE